MTIVMDKQIIFQILNNGKNFCSYANSNLEWSNPLLKNRPFETWDFNEFRKLIIHLIKMEWLIIFLLELKIKKFIFMSIELQPIKN